MVNPEQVVFLFDTIKEEDPLFLQAVLECHEMDPQTKCPCGYTGNEVYVCPKCGAYRNSSKAGRLLSPTWRLRWMIK